MQSITKLLTNFIWNIDIKSQPLWKQWLINIARFVYLIISDLSNGQLNLRAMSLVFTTILSFVPLIAVSFSVLKAFNVHNQVRPALLNLFAPLGDKAVELTTNIISFVDNVKVGLLGALGIAFLFYSVISLLTKVEEAFNYTWRISQTRRFTERFSNYLSVLMVGPVLVFTAMGATASLFNSSVTQSLVSIEPFGTLITLVTKLIPYFLIVLAFTFVYLFVPNTKVKLIPALTGGVAAGVLWQSVGYVYALFVTQSSTQTAIYAGFAILFFFMIWLYLSWLILLIGSSIAFYRQHPEYLWSKRRDMSLNNRDREQLALSLLLLISQNFYQRKPPISIDKIVSEVSLPMKAVEEVLRCYEDAGILHRVQNAQLAYLPAMPLENLTVVEAYQTIRKSYAIFSPVLVHNAQSNLVLPIIQRIDSSVERELGEMTIKQLVEMQEENNSPVNYTVAQL